MDEMQGADRRRLREPWLNIRATLGDNCFEVDCPQELTPAVAGMLTVWAKACAALASPEAGAQAAQLSHLLGDLKRDNDRLENTVDELAPAAATSQPRKG